MRSEWVSVSGLVNVSRLYDSMSNCEAFTGFDLLLIKRFVAKSRKVWTYVPSFKQLA